MSVDLELLKTILGFVSVFGATVSGVAALLVDYRDKTTGKITKWGRYALLGLGLSFLIGGSNLFLDYTQKEDETRDAVNRAREASEQTLRIVTDIDRTLNPLKDVRATFWATYPFDQPELAQYRQRLDEGVRALLPELRAKHGIVEGADASVTDSDGSIREISILPSSPLFPNRATERFAYTVLANTFLQIKFYKTPIDVSRLSNPFTLKPDLTMSFEPSIGKSIFQIREKYEPKTKKITVYGFEISSDSKYWNSSGKIASVLDLPGCQLVIDVGHTLVSFDEADKRVKPDLATLVLQVADQRGWWLRADKLKRAEPEFGSSVYVHVFPNTYRALLQEAEAE